MNVMEFVTVEVLKGEFGPCEICDNYTPRVVVSQEGYSDTCCQYCWEAYGEIN